MFSQTQVLERMSDLDELPAIPIIDTPIDAAGYGATPIRLDDPRNVEPLRSLSEAGIAGASYYHRSDGSNPPYGRAIEGSLADLWLRAGAVPRLRHANELLAPFGCELFVWDAYRSIETQRGLWRFHAARIARSDPSLSAKEVARRTVRYVSDPREFRRDDPSTWPIHCTGGAVDLTLRGLADGRLLDMGARFDQMDATGHSDHLERLDRSGGCENRAALLHRRLLHWAMAEAGFLNYPMEFWHFDWGDQMYAYRSGLLSPAADGFAWYGYIDPPEARRG